MSPLPTEAFPKYPLFLVVIDVFVVVVVVALAVSVIILLICSLVVVFLFLLEWFHHERGGVTAQSRTRDSDCSL